MKDEKKNNVQPMKYGRNFTKNIMFNKKKKKLFFHKKVSAQIILKRTYQHVLLKYVVHFLLHFSKI